MLLFLFFLVFSVMGFFFLLVLLLFWSPHVYFPDRQLFSFCVLAFSQHLSPSLSLSISSCFLSFFPAFPSHPRTRTSEDRRSKIHEALRWGVDYKVTEETQVETRVPPALCGSEGGGGGSG